MRIQALLELIEPEIRNFKTNRTFKDRPYNFRKEKNDPRSLGYGNFSKVRSTPEPHLVKKSSISTTTGNPRQDDAYWDFVNYVLKNKLWENPYFPRFYKKTSIHGDKDTSHHSVEMERLESFEKASAEDLISIIRKALTKEGREWVKIYSGKDPTVYSVSNTLADALENAVTSGDMSLIKDNELIKALKILNQYASNSKVSIDIHSENIMGRRTPVGLQLVISDPFSFKKDPYS